MNSVDLVGALTAPVVGSEGYILFRHYHGCKWYLLDSRLRNNFKILAQILVDPENTKQLVDFRGFQVEVKYSCRDSMDSINKADDKPTATPPPPGPSLPPAGRVTQGETLT